MRANELDLIHFQWAVYPGYRWMEHKEISFPELTDEEADHAGPVLLVPSVAKEHPPQRVWRHHQGELPREADGVRYYSLTPHQHSGLFMTFAKMNPSKQEILKFAQTYGHLGLDRHVGTLSEGYVESFVRGEYFDSWSNEIGTMRQVVDAWEMVNKKKSIELKEHVLRSVTPPTSSEIQAETIQYDPMPDIELRKRPIWGIRTAIPSTKEAGPELREILEKPSDFQVAVLYMQNVIDGQLSKHCKLFVIADAQHLKLQLHAVPKNLIGALWLQLALAISGNARLRKCKMCTTWYEIAPKARRQQSVYCGPPCKTRSTRKRMQIACELSLEGKSLSAIARQLETSDEQILRWVRSPKKK